MFQFALETRLFTLFPLRAGAFPRAPILKPLQPQSPKKSGFKVKAGDRGQPAPVVGKRSENKNYLRYTDFVCDNAGLYVPRRDCGRQLQQWLAMRRGGECEQPCFQCELEHFRAHVSIKMERAEMLQYAAETRLFTCTAPPHSKPSPQLPSTNA